MCPRWFTVFVKGWSVWFTLGEWRKEGRKNRNAVFAVANAAQKVLLSSRKECQLRSALKNEKNAAVAANCLLEMIPFL